MIGVLGGTGLERRARMGKPRRAEAVALATVPMTTTPNTLQHRARELLDQITV
jgi:hypothetical protein